MNFLIIDGNSLINRAFYGIKLLTAKDGHFTNAIFGFMNMFLSLEEQTTPDAVAVAFDMKAPTFRHKMYDQYKAGRKPMPPELYEQMEPLKAIALNVKDMRRMIFLGPYLRIRRAMICVLLQRATGIPCS